MSPEKIVLDDHTWLCRRAKSGSGSGWKAPLSPQTQVRPAYDRGNIKTYPCTHFIRAKTVELSGELSVYWSMQAKPYRGRGALRA